MVQGQRRPNIKIQKKTKTENKYKIKKDEYKTNLKTRQRDK
jgi:hypothetical protein